MGTLRILQLLSLLLVLISLFGVDALKTKSRHTHDSSHSRHLNGSQMHFGKEDIDIWKNWGKEKLKSLAGHSLVSYINSKVKTFKAKLYTKFEGLSVKQLNERFLGLKVHPTTMKMLRRLKAVQRLQRLNNATTSVRRKRAPGDDCIPKNFDARKKWPMCRDVIENVQDQGQCGACWAVAAAAAFTDVKCIHSKGKDKARLSAWDLGTCCEDCQGQKGSVCGGGDIYRPAKHFVEKGVVTGEGYKGGGCRPYEAPPGNTGGDEFGQEGKPTPCQQDCQSSYTTKQYGGDKHFGSSPKQILPGQDEDLMRAIKKSGSVVMGFKVIDDFMKYKSGIYVRSAGREVGGHAVKLIGWGEEQGRPYWIGINSWSDTWGEKGVFKWARGSPNDELIFYFAAVEGKS